MKTLIIIGGVFWLVFFVFHLFFWKLFDWKEDLNSLSKINNAVMQILNLCLMVIFLVFAYVSIFHPDELLNTPLGKSLLVGITFFCAARAVEQVIFFGLKSWISAALFTTFLVGTALYLIPLVW